MNEVSGKNILVVGLARSGLAAARRLAERGAAVTVTDQSPPEKFSKEIPELLRLKIGMELGLHREETFLRQDAIVVSPGVPADLPVLNLARKKGLAVVPEVEVAGWFLTSRLAGITGTNGKTTTTALLGKMLEASGFSTFVGGNIGVPLISALDRDPQPSIAVAELSSFQLETIEAFRPHVAALLNLTPNHLDRHPDFDAYVAAKARIFKNQTESDYAILNADDNQVMSLAPEIRSRKIYFSRKRELAEGVFLSGRKIQYRIRNLEADLMETSDIRLRGEFNLENVLAAAAAACVLGAGFGSIRRAAREFYGVEHRLEFVGELKGVEFYNDSKATSVDATLKALSSFERGVHLILGGKDKGAPYAPLRGLLEGRAKEVLVIGAASERIKNELAGAAELVDAGDLETAVRRAFDRARSGDVILLAPACSSFDQFENFEHRGRAFKDLVERLAVEYAGKRPAGNLQQSSETGQMKPEPANAAAPAADAPGLSILDADEAGPDEDPDQKRNAPEPPRLSAPRELEYVYEVSAEEISPGPAPGLGDEIEEPVYDAGKMADVEPVEDEVLAFEVRRTPDVKRAKPTSKRRGAVRAGSTDPGATREME